MVAMKVDITFVDLRNSRFRKRNSSCFRVPEEIHRAAEKIRQDIGNVSIVVQNAGREIDKQIKD